MEIFYSPQFEREYRRLSFDVKEKIKKKERIFRENPFDPRLKTHKLHGRLDRFCAFSVDYRFRIIFGFLGEKKVRFHAVDDHSVYERF
ncbi:MAG: type II toxin-antitoxin system mRNA interferase toxin, RelE/StbE family [Candidatus Wildermuthbacteria bacterium]|nr:type II toxin-antitoxin system mRNA interferase toxin, RelE/StbE family [Candidatus Wildermuthbacteria bacterium]